MTDPTPEPVWVSALAARRHVQESAPDAAPAAEERTDHSWAEFHNGVVEGYEADLARMGAERDSARIALERAESNARGKQAVIEAQRATLDRVRALPLEWARDWRDAPPVDRVLRKITADLCLALDAPQPEAGGDDE